MNDIVKNKYREITDFLKENIDTKNMNIDLILYDEKTKATAELAQIIQNMTTETDIENLVKAKGFIENPLALCLPFFWHSTYKSTPSSVCSGAPCLTLPFEP